MDISGVIQGPPETAKPSQSWKASFTPILSASLMANFTNSQKCGVSCVAGGLINGGLPGPFIGMRYKPSIPAFFVACKSAVIPSLVTAPYIQYQNTQGLASSGGCR